jgi:hypothetical protein
VKDTPSRSTLTPEPSPRPSAGKRREKEKVQTPRKKGFNWAGFLIESAIAIVVFNIIAAIVTWVFILPRLRH